MVNFLVLRCGLHIVESNRRTLMIWPKWISRCKTEAEHPFWPTKALTSSFMELSPNFDPNPLRDGRIGKFNFILIDHNCSLSTGWYPLCTCWIAMKRVPWDFHQFHHVHDWWFTIGTMAMVYQYWGTIVWSVEESDTVVIVSRIDAGIQSYKKRRQSRN